MPKSGPRRIYEVTQTHVEATEDGESGTLLIDTDDSIDLLLCGSRQTLGSGLTT